MLSRDGDLLIPWVSAAVSSVVSMHLQELALLHAYRHEGGPLAARSWEFELPPPFARSRTCSGDAFWSRF